MKIIVNNKEVNTMATTILELSTELSLPDRGVAVAVANKMIPREEWSSKKLSEGMSIIVIKAVCGG